MSNPFAADSQRRGPSAGQRNMAPGNTGANRASGVGGDAWSGLLVDGNVSDDSDSDDSDHGRVAATTSQRQRQAMPQAVPRAQTRNESPSRSGRNVYVSPPSTAATTSRPPNDSRASWTTRAAAVGSRPPDTASQNPPSLKLLGLKSVKDGGQQYASSAGGDAGQGASSSSSNGSTAMPSRAPALEIRQQIEQRQRQEQAQRQDAENQQRSQRGLIEEQRRMQGQREHEKRQAQSNTMAQPRQQQARSPSPQAPALNGTGWSSSADAFEMVPSPRVRDEQPERREQDLPSIPSLSTSPIMQGSRDAQHDSFINFGASDGFGGVPSLTLSRDRRQEPPRPLHIGVDSPRGYQLQDTPSPRPSPLNTPVRAMHPFSDDESPEARRALTRQLGLESESGHGSSRTRTPATTVSPMHKSGSGESFASGYSGKALVSPHGSTMSHQQQLPPLQSGLRPLLTQQASSLDVRGEGYPRSASPMGSLVSQTRSLSPASASPHQQIQGESIALQRGMPAPVPLALPSPVHPPAVVNAGPAVPLHARQQPTGFSDAQPQRAPSTNRKSMLRRSMAFFKGSPDDQPQGGPRGPPASGNGPAQRQSLFRRSMMRITGRGPATMPMAPDVVDVDDPRSPLPRVQGFVDEKPRERKSQYLGGGGMGDEWDVNGYGARFWKRFSLAQHMQEQGAYRDVDNERRKLESRRRFTLYGSLIGGVLIIAAVIAVIVWRENVKSSAVPSAVNRNEYTVSTSTSSKGTTAGVALSSQSNAATVQAHQPSTDSSDQDSTDGSHRKRALERNASDEVVAKVRKGVASVHPLSRDVDAAVVDSLVRRHAQQHQEHHAARMAPVVRRRHGSE